MMAAAALVEVVDRTTGSHPLSDSVQFNIIY